MTNLRINCDSFQITHQVFLFRLIDLTNIL
jgi:hypothetical protein